MAYDPNNIFAKILRDEAPAHRVYEDHHTIAIMDVMPQSDGHTLVIPKVACQDVFEIDAETAVAVMRTAQKIARGVQQAFQPDGVALMQFNGAAAGQTVFHFHLHVIPRYEDRPLRGHGRDFADSAVLQEHAERLRQALKAL